MGVQEQLGRIAADLDLGASGEEQDWGIELSDADRVSEFLGYYETRSDGWLPWVRREFADLVLQSANEALEEGVPVPEDELRRFASSIAAAAPDVIAYWSSLTPTAGDPWPVQRLLRDAGT